MSDPLPLDLAVALQITEGRRGRFGQPVYYFTQVGSTNDVAAALAERGAPEGTLVVAAAQMAGRGRLGRVWYSPADAGIYASLVCRSATAAPYLTLAGGVAVAEGVRAATGLPVEIKWPNDVIVASGGSFAQRRKVAGVLAEASSGPQGLLHVVLGFGVNLRRSACPPSLGDRVTSLETELGRPVDTGAVLAEILVALAESYEALARGQSAELLAHWRALAPSAHGAPVDWTTPDGRRSGVTAGVAADGALLVRVENRIERIMAGEIVWR